MKIRAFITHKKAEHFKDCQDRFSINVDTKSVAVSDGMSQSYQQKAWAEILVNTFTENAEWVPNLESIKELAPLWTAKVHEFIQQLKDDKAPQYLVIMNENALVQRKSAGATFCGIRFDRNYWSGDVLGDSCLIELKRGKIKNLYTSQTGEKFDNHPDYFDSNPLIDGKGTPRAIKGCLDRHSIILIVSDPLSDFLNEKKKLGNEDVYVHQLLNIKNHDDFEELIAEWRDLLKLHNDDTTLVIIEYDGHTNFDIEWCDNIDSLIKSEEMSSAQRDISVLSDKENLEKEQDSAIEEIIISPSMEPKYEDEFSGTIVSKDEFVRTGMEQYEIIKAECRVGFMLGDKNDDDILQKMFGELYELYRNNFIK